MTAAVESSAVAARPVPSAPADTHSGSRWSRLWRNAAVFAWLLLVYAACFQQAISTMAALSAQQEILAKERSVAASANGDKAVPTNGESKNISAKAQLVKAIKLLQDMEIKENTYENPDDSKNDTNQPNENGGGKNDTNQVNKNSNDSAFDKLTPWVQSAAIEARAGFYNTDNLNYIIMPIALVTLMLCLWMGALGSAVHMTLEFLKKDETKTGLWFFFRPFYGALLALAVFIIFQAGQMVLTNPVEGNAGLNPYVIAFVAIVSGMLSDQAYHRIAFAGSQFLGKADATPRWVRTSVAQEKLATRTVADLLRHT
ncbi:MAG: hypothetical protein U1E43_07850, partial [Rhodospirillales bacterium]